MKRTANDLIFEIGCENLPPHAIRPAFEQLRTIAEGWLTDNRLSYDSVYTTGAPRRLVLLVRGLATAQASTVEEVTGPPVSKAFDENGKPTKAAIGFARSHGVDPAKLQRVQTERGEYLGLRKTLESKKTAALLKTGLPELVGALRFPKMMHWEATGFRFARPIRWLLCMFGDKVVRFQIAGVSSGNKTYSTPWIHRGAIPVTNAKTYLTRMKKANVIIDHDERKKVIKSLAVKASATAGHRLIEDEALFEELVFMLENPRVLVGGFDKKYLSLPAAVVVTAMKSHQRYLALETRGKKLVPKFMTFTEGKVGAPSVVRNGNEKVLRARLEDALFYWREDLKTGIEGLAEKLGSIVYIEGLGTLMDKAKRLSGLGVEVSRQVSSGLSTRAVEKASRLAKADLASEMVKDGKEFTLLQGLIGSHYANEAGIDGEVVTAIREHYMPRTPNDAIPTTALGQILSVADRIDTITGCFIAGFAPTGSQDPYALRRQANGLLRVLEKTEAAAKKDATGVSIEQLIKRAVGLYSDQGIEIDEKQVRETLRDFFVRRSAQTLKEGGYSYDVVGAVTPVAWSTPAAAVERVRAIQALRGNDTFELVVTGVKRVGNILDPTMKLFGVPWQPLHEAFGPSGTLTDTIRFDASKFEDDAERGLHEAIVKILPKMERLENASDISGILKTLSTLGPPIDHYFDKVLVNSPNESLRSNRHQFLAAAFALFSKYADFSHIVEVGDPVGR